MVSIVPLFALNIRGRFKKVLLYFLFIVRYCKQLFVKYTFYKTRRAYETVTTPMFMLFNVISLVEVYLHPTTTLHS